MNIKYLKKHLQLNKCENVEVIEAAVCDVSGTAFFEEYEECVDSIFAKINPEGKLKVKTVSLDDLVLNSKIPPPDYIKVDVEGAEMLVFKGAKSILSKFKPTIFLSIHSYELYKECCDFLKNIGYNLKSIKEKGMIVDWAEMIASKDEI